MDHPWLSLEGQTPGNTSTGAIQKSGQKSDLAPLTTKSLTTRLSHAFIPFVESDVHASSLLPQKSLRMRARS